MVLGSAREPQAGGVMMVFPDDVQGHGVEFDHAGCQSEVPWHPEVSIAGPSAVVEEQYVAFSGEALGDHMSMVQADELTKFPASLGVFGVVWSYFPDDVASGSIDDCGDVGVSLADDEVLGVEAGVGDGVHGVPFVGAEQGEGVGMEDVAVREDAWVDVHAVFGLLVEAKFVEMLTRAPHKSCGCSVPVHLVDDVVFEEAKADAAVPDGVVGKDQGVALWEKVLAGGVVADWVSFSFEIMVLPGSVVFPVLIAPDDASVPVILIEVREITAANPNVSEFVSRDEGSSW